MKKELNCKWEREGGIIVRTEIGELPLTATLIKRILGLRINDEFKMTLEYNPADTIEQIKRR